MTKRDYNLREMRPAIRLNRVPLEEIFQDRVDEKDLQNEVDMIENEFEFPESRKSEFIGKGKSDTKDQDLQPATEKYNLRFPRSTLSRMNTDESPKMDLQSASESTVETNFFCEFCDCDFPNEKVLGSHDCIGSEIKPKRNVNFLINEQGGDKVQVLPKHAKDQSNVSKFEIIAYKYATYGIGLALFFYGIARLWDSMPFSFYPEDPLFNATFPLP